MELFYQPANAVLGDVIPYYEDGTFYLFYLKNWGDYEGEDRVPGWHLLKTKDLLHMESEEPIGIDGGTGCVIKVEGIYHLYYCIFEQNPQRQYVCHATSSDLKNWTKYPKETFGPDEKYYLLTDWRDPHVIWNEEEKCWWMVLCAQSQGKTKRRGCVGLCKSTDLHHWTCCKPLYSPEESMSAYECPDLFYENGWWYLVFSQFTDRFETIYRRSRTLQGPWLRPGIDSFDGRAFYAAKTCSDGEHRYIFGWNPTRMRDIWKCNPAGYDGMDMDTYDWGGSMMPHEIWQDADGCLYVKPVPAVRDAAVSDTFEQMEPLTGEWTLHGAGRASVNSPYGYAAMLLGEVKENARLAFDLTVSKETRYAGVAIGVDEEFSSGYYVLLDFCRQRAEFRSPIRMTERGGQLFPYTVELERPLPFVSDGRYHVEVIVSGTVLAAYVNDKVALGARMYDRDGGRFGVFLNEGTGEVEK